MANALIVLALTTSLVVLAYGGISGSSYCNMKTCGGPTHTFCKYPILKTSKQCGKVKTDSLTKKEIKELVYVHNAYREFVATGQELRGNRGPQPAATNLRPLKWDQELADIAQTWADQCDYGHDKCRNVVRFRVGQNVVFKASTGNAYIPLSELVKMWYDEVEYFDKNQVKSVTNFTAVGHYTQMMWADTTLLGCGAVRYNSDGIWNKVYLVCNYGPTGNWKKGEMYQTL